MDNNILDLCTKYDEYIGLSGCDSLAEITEVRKKIYDCVKECIPIPQSLYDTYNKLSLFYRMDKQNDLIKSKEMFRALRLGKTVYYYTKNPKDTNFIQVIKDTCIHLGIWKISQ